MFYSKVKRRLDPLTLDWNTVRCWGRATRRSNWNRNFRHRGVEKFRWSRKI